MNSAGLACLNGFTAFYRLCLRRDGSVSLIKVTRVSSLPPCAIKLKGDLGDVADFTEAVATDQGRAWCGSPMKTLGSRDFSDREYKRTLSQAEEVAI